MKTEIEARLLNVDIKNFIEKLTKVGATFVGDWIQMRNIYDFNPVKDNSWIRLRTNGIETTLTIKEIKSTKIDGTKETEIVVSDFDACDEILNKLGYVARSRQENRRIRFILNGVEIDIDRWPFIPDYVEFEAKSDDKIKEVCKILNIDYDKLVTDDVVTIYHKYGYSLNEYPNIVLEEKRKTEKYNYSFQK